MSPPSPIQPTIVGDRLYSLSFRPQELAVYGEKVSFRIRYSPIFDDEGEIAERHFKLLVLEIEAELPASDGLGDGQGQDGTRRLQLLKIGWELELAVSPAQAVGTLPELSGEVPRLLDRIAGTVNDLARRAACEPPLGADVQSHLLIRYRTSESVPES